MNLLFFSRREDIILLVWGFKVFFCSQTSVKSNKLNSNLHKYYLYQSSSTINKQQIQRELGYVSQKCNLNI